MASPTAVAARVDRRLQALLAEVRALAGTAQKRDTLPDGERAAVALDWDHLLADYLAELECLCRSGEMSAEQQERYRQLLQELQGALPIFDRLGLLPLPITSTG